MQGLPLGIPGGSPPSGGGSGMPPFGGEVPLQFILPACPGAGSRPLPLSLTLTPSLSLSLCAGEGVPKKNGG